MAKNFGKDSMKQRFNAVARHQNNSAPTTSFGAYRAGGRGRGGRGGFGNQGGRGGRGGNSFSRGGRGGGRGDFSRHTPFKKKWNDDNVITFDRDKRIEFVTGFKKRKDERRVVAKQKMKEEKKQERLDLKKTKADQRRLVEEQYEQLRQLKRAEMGLPPEDAASENDAEAEGSDKNALVEEDIGGMFEKE